MPFLAHARLHFSRSQRQFLKETLLTIACVQNDLWPPIKAAKSARAVGVKVFIS